LWRIWPYLAIAPLALLAVAIFERVGAYGLTPDRYMLALMGALCAANASVALLAREKVLRFAPTASAIALTLGSIGPWGAIASSTRWQKAALFGVFAAHGQVADGRLVTDGGVPEMSKEEARRCRAAVDYLRSAEANALAPLLAAKDERLSQEAGDFCPPEEPQPRTTYQSYDNNTQWTPTEAAEGFAILGSFQLTKTSKIHSSDLSILCEGGRVTVFWRNEPPAVFDMTAIARAQDANGRALLRSPLLKPTSGNDRLVFLVQHLTVGVGAEDAATLDSLNGFLLRRDEKK
jgi:hypothetical protein